MAEVSEGLIEKRRTLVGFLWVKGNSIRDITAELKKQEEFKKLSKDTVNRDIQAIKERLIQENIGKIEGMRARSVAVLRKLQTEAWDSLANVAGIPFRDKASYLRVIADCEEKIAKLQGTFAPVKIAPTDTEGKSIILQLVPAKVEDGGS